MKEYIGITGFKTLDEINETRKAYETAGINKDSRMSPMYGFLVFGQQANNDKIESKLSPSLKNLDTLLKDVSAWMMPTIHYCAHKQDLDVDNVSKILDYGRIADHTVAIQLNVDWPSAKSIAVLKDRYPNLYIIQQVNPDFPGVDIINKAIEYEGLVDKLLIDPSLGAGIPYDIWQTANIINKLAEKTNKFSYVICGGLDNNTVFNKLFEAGTYTDQRFSIDAEGKLRTPDRTKLDLDKSKNYILKAGEAFKIMERREGI